MQARTGDLRAMWQTAWRYRIQKSILSGKNIVAPRKSREAHDVADILFSTDAKRDAALMRATSARGPDGREREANMNGFYETVYEIVASVPSGRVTTYGDIARAAGFPWKSREVGWALHVNPYPDRVPCFRVVNRVGRLAPAFGFGGPEAQRMLLERDGIDVEERDGELFVKDFEARRFVP